ncbi:MAG: HIRAN domain-containing protein [bacterium]
MNGYIITRVVGVTFPNEDGTSRQHIIRDNCYAGQMVDLIHEEDNPRGQNAIKVCTSDGKQIGYIPKEISSDIVSKSKDFDFYALINHTGLFKNYYAKVIIFVVSKEDDYDVVQNLIQNQIKLISLRKEFLENV